MQELFTCGCKFYKLAGLPCKQLSYDSYEYTNGVEPLHELVVTESLFNII
jgi:hypothetical protein